MATAPGDDVLKAVAASIKRQLRNVDMVFRFGGEEFLILLSNTSREAAALVGERLRFAAQVEEYIADGRSIELTVSLGCSTCCPASLPRVCCDGPTTRCTWPSARGVIGWRWRAKPSATTQNKLWELAC
jgi:hypothetical protein